MEAVAGLVVLSIILGGTVTAVVLAYRQALADKDARRVAEVAAVLADDRAEDAAAERDLVRAELEKVRAELVAEQAAHADTRALLAAAEEALTHELQKQIHVASPDDLARIAAGVLADRRALMSTRAEAFAAAGPDRRGAGPADVPDAGAAAAATRAGEPGAR